MKKYCVLIKFLVNPSLNDGYFLNNFKQNKAYFTVLSNSPRFDIGHRSRCFLQIICSVDSSSLLNLFLQLSMIFIVFSIPCSHYIPITNGFCGTKARHSGRQHGPRFTRITTLNPSGFSLSAVIVRSETRENRLCSQLNRITKSNESKRYFRVRTRCCNHGCCCCWHWGILSVSGVY